MTDELIKELTETLKSFQLGDRIASIIILLGVVFGLFILIWEHQRMKKIKKFINEYKVTLTPEQLKAINDYKELTK